MKPSVLSTLFAAATCLVWAVDSTSLAGKWKFHSSIQGYETEMDCTLTQDGQDVTGTCKSSEAPKPVAMTGKVTDKQVTLQHKADYNGEQLTIVYTAKLEKADQFSGTVDVQPMNVDGEFTATAVK